MQLVVHCVVIACHGGGAATVIITLSRSQTAVNLIRGPRVGRQLFHPGSVALLGGCARPELTHWAGGLAGLVEHVNGILFKLGRQQRVLPLALDGEHFIFGGSTVLGHFIR